MCPKTSFGTGKTLLLVIAVSVCLLSCGDVDLDIDQEQTEEPLKFIEFVLFPTAPYIDKSYVEKVPEEEVVVRDLDFEVEKAAIQEVYRAFIKAYVAEDMTALQDTLDSTAGIEFGTNITGVVYGWNDVKIYIQGRWEELDCQGDPNWELIDFYIRPENVSVPWVEASAKGPMFYYTPDLPSACYNALGRFYFTKKSGEWRIHQIDGSKYFTDNQHKVP
ncbi:hypothetical protein F4Z99_15820 [Candidatus Poribacteria bacterium]|nr:hypothetical protein [Candidatus Poribacteria bacterium]MYB02499.1 hypothetical protein [Candidatus Poribacteria bacterium]